MKTLTLMVALLALAGCAKPSGTYVHSSYDFSSMKKVAVFPFENLSQDQSAGEKVRKAVIAEMLAQGVVDVVEPGQVNRLLAQQNIQSVSAISIDDLKKLGTALGVQAIVLGSVDT